MENETKYFSVAVAEKIGHYVYRLIDPRNGETFYVGKGKGNRIFDHMKGVISCEGEQDDASEKISRIKEIRNANLKVLHVIHRHEIPNDAIFEVEAALIDAYPGLSNIQGGHGSNSKGPMHVDEIIDKYELPELTFEPRHKLVLININQIEDRSERKNIYDQTRFAWRISVERARKADYVLAVRRGVVIGAFVAEEWIEGKSKNFPELNVPNLPGRWGFKGKDAPSDIWEEYVGERKGKRIVNDKMKHVQNPVRYWGI